MSLQFSGLPHESPFSPVLNLQVGGSQSGPTLTTHELRCLRVIK